MKVYVLYLKEVNEWIVYKTLKGLCESNQLGVSKGTLDRFDFENKDFDNEICQIKKRYPK